MNADHKAIEDIITRQFGSLSWTPNRPGDWNAFISDFLPGASLYPVARPVKKQTPAEFVSRMQRLAESKLRSFKEDVLGHQIRVFGNVAVAVAGCRITENGKDISQGVEMMLLVKEKKRCVADCRPGLGYRKRFEKASGRSSPAPIRI